MAAPGSSPGQRLYMIRLACGDGTRTPETLDAFAARIKRVTKVVYHATTLSLLERDKQQWRLKDFETLAKVDPLRRGAPWLAFNLPEEARPEDDSGTGGVVSRSKKA